METPKAYGKNQEPQMVVRMPSLEEMNQKLTDAKLLGNEQVMDGFFKKFASSVADSEKVGMGLNLAWELAKYDSFQGYPPVIAALADMYYDRVIDAVTPNTEVAIQAKEFHKEILEKVRNK